MQDTIIKFICEPITELVILAIVMDTVFGVFRAVKEHKFNSSVGIDGAIRKVAMIFSMVFLAIMDSIVSINLIGFIPEVLRNYMPFQTVGTREFFGILFLCYEAVSILKNMALCGLPVKKVWLAVKNLLSKYTDELPDNDGLEEGEQNEADEKK